jgi:O-antigen/teichoic acid export membrane protein
MVDEPSVAGRAGAFSDRVLILFATSIWTTGIGIAIGFVLARVLGPSGKGNFYIITLLPYTIMVFIQLGLPQAFGFYAARGRTIGISTKTFVLAGVLAAPTLAVTFALLPFLRAAVLDFVDPAGIVLGLAALPFVLNATFTAGVVLGRQAVRWYSLMSIGLSLCSIVLYLTLVGVLGLGLMGALWAFLLDACLTAIAFLVGSIRVSAAVANRARISYRELFGYGLPYYPGSLTQFFILRVDVYLIAWLVADPAAPLGYYSMAVTIAQFVLFLSSSVSSLFFPHVAASSQEESNRQVPMVARVTLLLTSGMALALVPCAIILIRVLLPAFEPSLPPLFVLLPGLVAFSLARVLSSYIAGRGMPQLTSYVNVGALVVNVVANLLLIPPLGILGAAVASLISYSASAITFSVLAARIVHGSVADFWIPRPSDVRFVLSTLTGMGRRVLRRGANPH